MQRDPKDKQQKNNECTENETVIKQENVNPEFMRIAKKNLERYRPAMEELAK